MDNQNTGTVNVEEIINELRQEIKSRNMVDIEDFEDVDCYMFSGESKLEEFNKAELVREIDAANNLMIISPDVQLEGKGKFIKRVIRKLSYFIIRQLAAVITECNIHVVSALEQINNYIFSRQAADEAVEELKVVVACDVTSKVAAQTSKLREISEENLKMKQRLSQYDESVKAYEYDMKKANAEIELLRIKLETLERKYQLLAERTE